MKRLMVTIHHPRITSVNALSGTIKDYITVPAIDVRGTWTVLDMLNDQSIANALTAWKESEKNDKAPRRSYVSRTTASRNRSHVVAHAHASA